MTLNILAELKENFFIDLALLLIIGILGGKAAEVFRLPKATGYILFGILFGSGFLNVLDGELLKRYAEIKYAAIGLIGYNIGLELDQRIIKDNHKKVLLYTFAQALTTFVLVGGAVYFLVNEFQWVYALLLGSIAVVTTPAPFLACVKSYRFSGKITDMVCEMMALDDVIGIIQFALVLPVVVIIASQQGLNGSLPLMLAEPIVELVLSLVIGVVIAEMTVRLLEYYNNADRLSLFIIVVLALFLAIGIAATVNYSSFFITLVIGFVVRNRLDSEMFHNVTRTTDTLTIPVLLLFFVLSGAELRLEYLTVAGWIGLTYLAVRFLAKVIGIFLASKAVKETDPGVNYLGFMMIPQGAVALDLAILTEVRFAQLAVETGNTLYYSIGNTVLAVVFMSIIFSKILGEILVKWASVKAGQTYIEEDHSPHSHLV
jgi:NhaP-type Na+/H+ or K+/H+ antiporter